MIAVLSLLLILGASVMFIRIAAVALETTGLSRDSARFQARSAFTGVGFTTTEAENVVSHPVRRRIVMWLMLVGNIGIVSVMAAVLVSAIDLRSQQGVGVLAAALVGGLVLLCLLSSSRWVDRKVCGLIAWALRRLTNLAEGDAIRLLNLRDGYGVTALRVQPGKWLAGKALRETGLSEEGLLLLGIEGPNGEYSATPDPDTTIREGDQIVLYGRTARIEEFGQRKNDYTGEPDHPDGESSAPNR